MAQLYNIFNVNFCSSSLGTVAVLHGWNPNVKIKDATWELMIPI